MKPYLSPLDAKWGKIFVVRIGDWDVRKWRLVMFSDESKFNLFGSDGIKYCQRRAGEAFLKRSVNKAVVHGGGSLMVWGYTTSKGVGRLHRIRGHLNAPKYCVILNESLLGTLRNRSLSPCLITLRHSNNSKCRSRLANT